MDLVTGSIAGHSLNSDYYNGDGNGDIYTYFGQDIDIWTGYDSGDSCNAWRVTATSYYELVRGDGRDFSDYYALCE